MSSTLNEMTPDKFPDPDTYSGPELVGVLVFHTCLGAMLAWAILLGLRRAGVL